MLSAFVSVRTAARHRRHASLTGVIRFCRALTKGAVTNPAIKLLTGGSTDPPSFFDAGRNALFLPDQHRSRWWGSALHQDDFFSVP
jgi:hypothetical protein